MLFRLSAGMVLCLIGTSMVLPVRLSLIVTVSWLEGEEELRRRATLRDDYNDDDDNKPRGGGVYFWPAVSEVHSPVALLLDKCASKCWRRRTAVVSSMWERGKEIKWAGRSDGKCRRRIRGTTEVPSTFV